MDTKFVIKCIVHLFDPLDVSLNLLREIDYKLDAQKISELNGAFKTIEQIQKVDQIDHTPIQLALRDFNNGYEYFDLLLKQTVHEINQPSNSKGLKRIKNYFKMGRDFYGFGGGILDRTSQLITKGISYSFYKLLSSYGKLICSSLLEEIEILDNNFIKIIKKEYEDGNLRYCLDFGCTSLYFAKSKGILFEYPNYLPNDLHNHIQKIENYYAPHYGKIGTYGMYTMMKYNIRPIVKQTLILFWFINYLDWLCENVENFDELDDFEDYILPKNWNFTDIIK